MLCYRKEDADRLDHNDLARHPYLALFDLGKYSEQMSECESGWIQVALARFMQSGQRDPCLVIPAEMLKENPESSLSKIAAASFYPLPDADAYIAVASMNPDPHSSAQYFCKPLEMDEGKDPYPYHSMIARTLMEIEDQLNQASLEELISRSRR